MGRAYELVGAENGVLSPSPLTNNLNYIVFAMGYTEAVLNLYAGPLFANLIAGDLLDSAIWGISPILFFFLQPYLLSFITSGSNPYRRRFVLVVVSTFLLLVSYAALNYSQKWKWNYLTRLVNLDCGYIVLDLNLKVVSYIYSVEEEEATTKDQPRSVGVIQYHRLSFVGELTCYALALYICVYGGGQELYHWSLWRSSFVGCLLIAPIPILYLFKNRIHLKESYRECPEPNQISEQEVELQFRRAAKVQLTAYFLMRLSVMINLAYLTLWIMTGFLNQQILQNKAFMESVKIGGFYFLLSCSLCYLIAHLLKDYLHHLKNITCLFLMLFGFFLVFCWCQYSYIGLGVCIILTGAQVSLCNHLEAITQLQHLTPRVVLMAEFTAFCVIPILITFGTSIEDAEIFLLVSGSACLTASGLLIFV